MKLVPSNITKHELLGLHAHVVESTDPQQVSHRGTIIDETKGMLYLETNNGRVGVPKSICQIELSLPDGSVVRVDGTKLIGRSEDRMKKRFKRSWWK